MDRIKSLSEINYEANTTVIFKATVLSVDSDGDGERRPFKATIKLEDSGEVCQVYSWNFENLPIYKKAVNTLSVYDFEAMPNVYKEKEKQIRVGKIKELGLESTQKVLQYSTSEDIRREVEDLIEKYIPKNGNYSILREYLNYFILNDPNFWKWPAATKMHHNYPTGLSKHSLFVAKNAISIATTYKNSNVNIPLCLAGALLHDIGKLNEYNEDGSRNIYGNLVSHVVDGYGKLIKRAVEIGINPMADLDTLMLSHIILSHHDKLEFGSPVRPNTLEALIVSRADKMDAEMEASERALENCQTFTATSGIGSLDGGKLYKWHD